MKKKIFPILIAAVLLVSLVLTGCESGVAQNLYDQIAEQLAQLQQQLTELTSDNETIAQAKEDAEAALAAAQDEIAALTDQYLLVGATDAETAERIVNYYHETHVYDAYDLFVCSDMSAEVWNMLKAQGINALMAVGDPTRPAFDDIAQCSHAWVLAEVAPGEYLALETVGGYSVSRQDNGGYYRGWTFDTPADIKSYQELIIKYNVRVELRNTLNDEANLALSQGNNSLYIKLVELRTEQETELLSIRAEFEGLATKL